MSRYAGFRGILSDISYTDKPDYEAGEKVSLTEMAKKALEYLFRNPMPDHDWQCRFSFAPSYLPPFCPELQIKQIGDFIDPITEGDTENRNDIAFSMMREMLGDFTTGKTAEEAVHKRLLGYIKKENFGHGLCWNHGYSSCIITDSVYANLWTTGKLLQSECMRFRRGLCDASVARKLFEGIADAATRENGRAYFKNGSRLYNENEITGAYAGHYPVVMTALCEYWLVSSDERCRKLLYELAEGLVCDLQPDNLHRDDGGLDGHNHVALHSVRGMAQFAFLSGEPRYLTWVKDIYDYYRKWSLDTGWLPEIRNLPDHSNHSETCLNADMLELELWLALSGYDELWDQIERDFRNYFAPLQFKLTPELEEWYREVHSDAPANKLAAGIRSLRELEGGFISAVTPNDYIFELREGGSHFGSVEYKGKMVSFDMMGCCPPEGMRALYLVYKYTQQSNGNTTTVRMPFDSESSAVKVESFLPSLGRLHISCKKSQNLLVRIPGWAPRERVTVKVCKKAVPVVWSGCANQYISVNGLNAGDTVEVIYPLIQLRQTVTVTPYGQAPAEYRYRWIGNRVAEVSPKGKYLPLY